jgi:hypothetical protein
VAYADGINFTCNANINALATADGYAGNLCNSIQTTLSSSYKSLLTNANANIYIEFTSDTGLGASTPGFLNLVSYSTYFTALTSHSSGNTVDTQALASLNSTEASVFSGTNGKVDLTSALAQALGITSTNGNSNRVTGTLAPTTSPSINGGNTSINDPLTSCNVLTDGPTCYNGVIYLQNPGTISGNTQDYYYGSASTFANNLYDIYSIAEHEVNEILGTSSCVDGANFTNDCGNNAAAVDLFRYTAPGTVAVYPTTTQGYFSYDSGVTNVANYNSSPNREDYADFSSSCTHVQDATGCLGKALDITTDGGAEAKILDAVGYTAATPEPGTTTLLGSGLLFLGIAVRRRLS